VGFFEPGDQTGELGVAQLKVGLKNGGGGHVLSVARRVTLFDELGG
jgi:hypothetical protein